MTRCQNCGISQGPFRRDVLRVVSRKNTVVLVGCKNQAACAIRRSELDAKRYPLVVVE